MRFSKLGIQSAVAVALVAVAVHILGIYQEDKISLGLVKDCIGRYIGRTAVLEIITDSAAVYVNSSTMVPYGASAEVVFRDGSRYFVANGRQYGLIIKLAYWPKRYAGTPNNLFHI